MAQKNRKMEEFVTLNMEALDMVSYVDYFTQTPLFTVMQIKNSGNETVTDLTLTITNENGLIVSNPKNIAEVPFESTVEVSTDNMLSPHYFVGLEDVRDEQICIELKRDKQIICRETIEIKTLPFDYWRGLNGNAERLASFVRPKLADCIRLKTEIAAQLKKWDVKIETEGYESGDKNIVRLMAAALFTSIKRYAFTLEECSLSGPVRAGAGIRLLTERKATKLEMALFVSSCLESIGLHPVIIAGDEDITCGVWLYDSCFMDTVSDDIQRLDKYIAEGINNLSCFDVEDLFSHRNGSYNTSEKHFIEKLHNGNYYDRFVDIKRCRIAHILPMPLRARNLKGYEILSEEDMSLETAPKMLSETKKLSLDGKQTKNKQWERRLLDLSMKNTLLHFQPRKLVLHLVTSDLDTTLNTLLEKGEMNLECATQVLTEMAKNKIYFGCSNNSNGLKELVSLEISNGVLRTFSEEVVLNETINRLIKRSKEADEESGTKILYLAMGFLRWFTRDDSKEHYAPLVLQPVTLKKRKGGNGYSISALDEDFSINSTLLEYLKQEFNIDIRGLDGVLQGLKISEILAMVRAEVVNMKDWEVFDDAYVAAFSFARYQMWQDIRNNINIFSKNELISSLLNNRCEIKDIKDEELKEDNAEPNTTLMPLPADSSQWEAVALSQTGKTFVLHGPPGTGKSQTISNMIANALNDGKRVLFVAEKQAALSVVKKRLDSIGLGDFCLELHSNKTNKAEVLQKLQTTLALAGSQENVDIKEESNIIGQLKGSLEEPVTALHKKRRLGVSVYEAIIICLKNKKAPDIMNIESTFYDSLTKEKIESYENMMVQAAAAAKECGGVYNSPFSNVNLTEYSSDLRDAIYCSSEVVIAEIKHLKNYIALFLELYRQRISTLTRTKLEMLSKIAKLLCGNTLNKYFKEDENQFYAFFNANRRLDSCLEYYNKYFKKLIDISKDFKELGFWLDSGNTDYINDKIASSIVKKLSKVALKPLKNEDILKHLQNVCEIYESMECIRNNTKLSQNFTSAFGRIDFYDARTNFLSDLNAIHDICSKLFMDYNPDSFNSMCIRAANGYTKPVLNGLLSSIESFYSSEKSFLKATNGDKNQIPEEDVLDYYTSKAGALIDNIDMLANWCMYRGIAKKLDSVGLTFMTDALENGSVTGENIVSSFEKNIYRNFLQTNIPLDPVLSCFSATLQEENTEKLRLVLDEFSKLTKEYIRGRLISRLPTASTEGGLSLEVVNFQRLAKSNLRGMGLRKLFEEIPELIKVVSPCMLMSPITVSQYLQPQTDMFDMVIFDEASQMPTSEAIGSLARAKSAIVVGDPKQLPPTAFFNTNYVDEENLENEDMESVLDDCLALGIPQRRLTWHYRSKHESLIAFSNIMYYGNKLCTFPSPDGLDSKVKFNLVEDGVYDRGFTKHNKAEAEALVADVINRLSDVNKKKSSIGIVTFSNVQKEYIERKLSLAISKKHLESVAYDVEEPVFVKNLENVQGDERDVILFSVCYGPDKNGKMSLNFGPLNQAGGWRRLNVAVSRAREEMVIYSSMTGAMIDLSRTNSKGVAGLKAFLDFAEKGRTTLAIPAGNIVRKESGIGKYIAEELSSYGYDCRYDVGVSDFKIDVAVIDPHNKHKFILAVMCDAPSNFSIKDRNVLQIQTLKRNNWNVTRVYSINYYNNPKREIKKIKDLLDKLTGSDKKGGTGINRSKKPYKAAKIQQSFENATYVTSGDNDNEIIKRLKNIVSIEEPISYDFLVRRCLSTLGIVKYGSRVDARMQALVALCGFKYEKIFGMAYYRKTDKKTKFDHYRVETGETLRKNETDFTPYEVIALIKGALEDKVALYMDEIMVIVCNVFKVKQTDKLSVYINDCVVLGEEKGLFVRSVSDRISLA